MEKQFSISRCLIVLILLQGFWTSAFSQSPNDPIDRNKINSALVEELFLQKLNALRKEKGLTLLQKDPVLAKAAKDQADYQLKFNVLTHNQNVRGKEQPYQRVAFYKGTHGRIGENCLQTAVGVKVKNKDGSFREVHTYEELAEDFFQLWFHSPPHFQNMINPNYEMCGLSLALDPKTGKCYAAQVFGTKPFVPPFPEVPNTTDAWKILPQDSKFCTGYGKYENIAGIFSQYLWDQNDTIFQYYQTLPHAKEIMPGPTDGIALDIVFREQFDCSKNHNLHPSDVHDGIMLKPVFSKQLFATNLAKATNELFSYVGTVPPEARGKKYQINTILIKNGHACKYSYPVAVISKNLSLLKLRPVWMHYVGEIKPGSYTRKFSFDLPFESNSIELQGSSLNKLIEKLSMYGPFIRGISIHAYSSVDGKKEVNLKLQSERAQKIAETVKLFIPAGVEITTVAEENWALFRKQDADSIHRFAGVPDDEVKRKLSDKKTYEELKPFLHLQRVAKVELDVEVKWDEHTPVEQLPVAMHGVLADGDSLQARIIHSKMVYGMLKGKINPSQFIEIDIPARQKFVPVLVNYMGALSMTDDFSERSHQEEMVRAYELGKGHPKMEFNYLVYNLRYWASFGSPLCDINGMENKIEGLRSEMSDSLTNSLLLNYYVLSAYHFYVNKQFDRLYHSLEGVHRLYKLAPIYESDAIDLALIFNLYYRFDWSIDVLQPFIDPNSCSLEALFLFARTAAFERGDMVKDDFYYKVLQSCADRDKPRFCKWIDEEDFQLLRDEGVQRIWCKECAGH